MAKIVLSAGSKSLLSIIFLSTCVVGAWESAQAKEAASTAPTSAVTRIDVQPGPSMAKIISDGTFVVKGMKFPRVANPPASLKSGSQQASCCTIGDTRTTTGKALIDISTAKGTKKTKYEPADGPAEAVYSPPSSCWVISDYQRHITSANMPYTSSISATPANYSYVTSSQYEAVYQELKSYVLNLNILDKYKADILVNLSDFVRNYGSYSSSLSTSHGSVIHKARVQGAGAFNGRTWYAADVNTTETCCPPEIRNSTDLKSTLRIWVDETVKKLPKKLTEAVEIKGKDVK
jgi:hypothetical protein